MTPLIDTHCHLNLSDAFPEPWPVLDAAEKAGVGACVLIGIDGESSVRAVEMAEADPRLFAVVGWHPNYASSCTEDRLGEIERLLEHRKVVALGEIGLDYHWDYATPERQKEIFLAQLEIAAAHKAPVVLHCRKAYGDLLDILDARAPHSYLFHCFSGDETDAARAAKLDAYFGVDGPITYKNARALREIFKGLPHDRILIETDSPYLTPEPHRGKPNSPAMLPLINAGLAATLGLTEDACATLTKENALRFFSRMAVAS
ncbi:MAG TPA: TatD family hydrolase [Fimbriimonadaceae bacterium]|nr:TatD family hydrolase [Fimbriimonadaceae bacterium]